MGLQVRFSPLVTKLPKEHAEETIAFGNLKMMEFTFLTAEPNSTSSCTNGDSEDEDFLATYVWCGIRTMLNWFYKLIEMLKRNISNDFSLLHFLLVGCVLFSFLLYTKMFNLSCSSYNIFYVVKHGWKQL